MKNIALALFAAVAFTGVSAQDEERDEFEPVLEIKRPTDEAHKLELTPVVPRAPSAPEQSAAAALAPAIPLIGAASAPEVSVARPMERIGTMQQAAEKGIDPLNLRSTTSVLSSEELSKVDERSLLQVAIDEWNKVKSMSGAELLGWAKQNPAIPGGVLAVALAAFALLLRVLKRR